MKGPAAALAIVVLVATACGPQTDGTAATSAGAPAVQATPRPASPAASADASLDRAAFDALLEAWVHAADDGAKERAADRIVAAGDAGIARLVELIVAGDERPVDDLLALFGERAVPSITAALADARGFALVRFASALETLAPYWRESEQGPAVCRALLARIGEESGGYAVVSALEKSRPAGRSIARELAERWLHSPSESDRSAAISILCELGSDAASAAVLVIDAAVLPSPPRGVTDPASDNETEPEWTPPEEAVARFDGAVSILRAIGSGDPSILAELRRRLASGQPPDVRYAIAGVVASWGDAGAAAAPDLLAMLGDPEVADAASAALLAMPSQTDAVWKEIAAAYARGDAWTHEPQGALGSLARRRSIAEHLLVLLPTLPADDLVALHDVLARRGNCDLTTVADALLRHDDPRVRYAALVPWTEDKEAHPLPENLPRLLEDADAAVRARAAEVLSARGAAAASRIREVALPLLRDGERDTRLAALQALRPLAQHDPASLDAVLLALQGDSDDRVRSNAALIVAVSDELIAGERPALVESLLACAADVERFDCAYGDCETWARVLVRLPGGTEGLARAVTKALQSASTSWLDREFAIKCIDASGGALAAVRPALVRARDEATGNDRDELDRALASVSSDAESVARTGPADEATVRRLLAMGVEGRRAAVLLFGFHYPDDEAALRVWFAGVDMAPDLAAAARAADPLATKRRIGAANLARLLPDSRAIELLAAIADDETEAQWVAVRALTAVERRTPGAVPVGVVAKIVERTGGREGLKLAEALGARARELVPLLTQLRDQADLALSASASVALWEITHDAELVLPAIRRVLLSPSLRDAAFMIQWVAVGQTLVKMPLSKADFDAVLAVVRAEVHPLATRWFMPLLAKMGPDAAPAVPALTRIVAMRWHEDSMGEPKPDEAAEDAGHTLAAIGARAKPALSELRRFVAEFGDAHGVFRDAIAKIEAASR